MSPISTVLCSCLIAALAGAGAVSIAYWQQVIGRRPILGDDTMVIVLVGSVVAMLLGTLLALAVRVGAL